MRVFKEKKITTICMIAFTLAEVLVVIGIIGTVATLTLPNLNNGISEEKTIAKLKQTYTDLNQAQELAIAKYGPIQYWFPDSGTSADYATLYATRIMKFLKVSKTCDDAKGCVTDAYVKKADGANSTTHFEKYSADVYYRMILSNGATAIVLLEHNKCNKNLMLTTLYADKSLKSAVRDSVCGLLYLDIDGPNKGPFKAGTDFFYFYITKNGILPYGTKMDTYDGDRDVIYLRRRCFTDGISCASWVLKNNNMDYLHANSAGKCNDTGVYLSWEQTTCK